MIWGSYASTNKLFMQFIHKPKRLLACMDYIKTTSPQVLLGVSPSPSVCPPLAGLTFQLLAQDLFFCWCWVGFGFLFV